MTAKEYQEFSKRTLNSDLTAEELRQNIVLGLYGETGEVIDIIKKVLFHKHTYAQHEDDLKKEIGDVMWYLASFCTVHGRLLPDFDKMTKEAKRPVKMPGGDSGNNDRDYNVVMTLLDAVNRLVDREQAFFPQDVMTISIILIRFAAKVNVEMSEIFELNVEKLLKRYPDGFNPEGSINREEYKGEK